ncbi:Vi polysaccharide biosynthesis protein VipA/TviB [Pokkaliibacter plantistimulans]|uniref:Vi polysaccharide biosynthesis protein VipA/TviB n=1 Tax=Pokkaliibacter plantistimulans TaxID=1635171 RepID=A0ABX5LSL8_9GAMM|nr:Vi polysaccharide biosynthesis UDP-N-acetylglucosamine C-6 dehydrogenase TviB [Pokkaliibacter plantistimulans]PXF29622.1 Vi polysaccharide biosynthesis protein VipA/TviB [Pokkaliibacter plantistimulans]
MSPNPPQRIAIIGLGYVGLPLAVAFGRQLPVVGFDINPQRIAQLQQGIDLTQEVSAEELQQASQLSFSCDLEQLRDCDTYIITVPTPVDEYKQPDLTPLRKASASVAQVLAPGNLVIYESTVYPGATEEVCVPILEQGSGLRFNQDFYAGYSPERINPGDKQRRLETITKVTSGSTPEAAALIDGMYRRVVSAGTHLAPSIRVAEAAKVIENTQRDLNIALINELAIIFHRLGIDTQEVLAAAGTKWNFLPFTPGLVGGHCIGVDPYYLTHKAQAIGYHPEVILAGRRINDSMGSYVAIRVIRQMLKKSILVNHSRALVLGLTFKENCPDLRNSRVIDVIHELQELGIEVDVHDPWADSDEACQEYGVRLVSQPPSAHYDALILAVGHRQFAELGAAGIRQFGKTNHVFFDVKGVFAKEDSDGRL